MIIGWDIGGAHLKAAVVVDGALRDVAQWPCALWQGQQQLTDVLDLARQRWPALPGATHAVTMTGEMVDRFEHREAGVRALVAQLSDELGSDDVGRKDRAGRVRFFAGAQAEHAAWLDADAAGAAWAAVASANWAATRAWVARRLDDALLIDIGSTTTDLIPIRRGAASVPARDDRERLASGELVYQGVVRTPLACLAQRIAFADRRYNVMNEWFATTADVYRLTGELNAAHDQHPAADNGPKDVAGSCRRLARMIGHDGREAPLSAWIDFAHAWRGLQLRIIDADVSRVLGRVNRRAPIVVAGCGAFLATAVAAGHGRPAVTFDSLVGPIADAANRSWVTVCAPSAAIALLAAADRIDRLTG